MKSTVSRGVAVRSFLMAGLLTGCSAKWEQGRLYVGPAGANPVETARPAQPAPNPPPTVATPPPPPAPAATPASATAPATASTLHKLAGLPLPEQFTLPALARSTEPAPPGGDFYVAMHGDDTHPGTAEAPFATVRRAQQAVRELIAAGLNRNLRVWIRGGFYPQVEPWTFEPPDSGTEQFSITYAAHPGHRVIVSGGQRLEGWRKATPTIWAAALPAPEDASWRLRRLYVNGRSAIRARTPNLYSGEPFGRVEALAIDEAAGRWDLRVTLPIGSWVETNEVELVIFNHWEIIRKAVTVSDPRTRAIEWQGTAPLPIQPRPGVGCYLENDPGMLDQPGEWYYNPGETTVFYRPRSADELATGLIVAPRLAEVLRIVGTADQPVRNVHFEGLEIAHSNWQPPAYGFYGFQAAFHIYPLTVDPDRKKLRDAPPALVHWEFAERCSFRNGWLTQSGGTGLMLAVGCRDNQISGNRFYDIAGTGIMIGSYRDWRDEDHVARNNAVLANLITDVANVYHGGPGCWVGFAQNTRIAHNLITDLPYSGISVGWLWDNRPSNCKSNIIENNEVRRVMRWLADGGGIYTLGYQPGTIIRSNYVHSIQFSSLASGGAVTGIYLDNGSKGFLLHDNVAENVPLGLWVATDVTTFQWGPNRFPNAKPDGVAAKIGPDLAPEAVKSIKDAAGPPRP